MTEKYAGGRGFNSLTPEQRKAIASQGGRAAHASGHAHQFTSETARKAGAKRWEKKEAVWPFSPEVVKKLGE